MSIRIREVKNINILDIDGKIDINTSDLIETVGWLVNTGKINIVLNFEGVDSVDYNGLSVLAIAYKSVVNHKGKCKFVNVPLSVVELLKVVKLDSVFELYSDEETAINSFFDQDIENLHLRRKFTRLDIHIRVKYSIVGGQKRPKAFEGEVLNISGAGLYIFTQNTFPVNTQLDLEFSIPNSPIPLVSGGRVSWLADREIQPHFYPGMGVSFVHLDPEKEKAILDFIDKNVTHRSEPT